MSAFDETLLMQSMTAEQRLWFQSRFNAERKNTAVGVLLALFLGGLGAHHFYTGRSGLGVLYLLFCWTLIPAVVALVEAFVMPGRVSRFNETVAFETAAKVKMLATACVAEHARPGTEQ